MNDDHQKTVKAAFDRQAAHFDSPKHTIASREHLAWLRESLPLTSTDLVLEVAAGTALLGRALAPLVKKVVALEPTESMAEQGRLACAKEGIPNLEYRPGYAESLPFGDQEFDRVVCRLALHHFIDVKKPIAEMKRVAKPGATVSLIDLVSPDEPRLAEVYNHLERLRDPSHTRALTANEIREAMLARGFRLEKLEARDIEVDGSTWLAFTGCGPEAQAEIVAAWEADARAPTGMRPRREGNGWKFFQRWVIVTGRREA